MSVKHFCDFCGTEISGNHQEIAADTSLRVHEPPDYQRKVRVTITLGFDDLDPDICQRCVFAAVRSIDPGPREMEEAPHA